MTIFEKNLVQGEFELSNSTMKLPQTVDLSSLIPDNFYNIEYGSFTRSVKFETSVDSSDVRPVVPGTKFPIYYIEFQRNGGVRVTFNTDRYGWLLYNISGNDHNIILPGWMHVKAKALMARRNA